MYRIFDHTLVSDIPLPELPREKGSVGSIHVQYTQDLTIPGDDPQWIHEWQDQDGNTCIQCVLHENQYLLRFPGLCDFLITATGDQVQCSPHGDIPQETIRHLLLDQVIPRVLCHRGHLVLHASAVRLDDKVILFSGDTGSGKSTIASSFYRHGAELVTDDCLMIRLNPNNACCVPSYHGLRLFPDSIAALFPDQKEFSTVAHYTQKKRLFMKEGSTEIEHIPISAVVILSSPGDPAERKFVLQPIRGAEEMISLIQQLFLLDVKDKNRIATHFDNIKALVDRVPAIYRLQYPHEYSRLDQVREEIQSVLVSE